MGRVPGWVRENAARAVSSSGAARGADGGPFSGSERVTGAGAVSDLD